MHGEHNDHCSILQVDDHFKSREPEDQKTEVAVSRSYREQAAKPRMNPR